MNKKRKHNLSFALMALLLLAIAVFLTGVLGDLRGARLDLTEDRLFTLSESARDILGGLRVPVQVTYYVSAADHMPTELKTLERDVSDKLRDFSEASGGQLRVFVRDPGDDEELKQTLMSRNIRPFQVQTLDRDEVALKLIYSTISITYMDAPEEVLPQVMPRNLTTLEYEIISRVYKMTREKKPVVAVYAPKPQMDPQLLGMYLQMGQAPPEMPDIWQGAIEVLGSESYDVRRIDLTEGSPIPSDADALFVLGPTDLGSRQAWEIGNAVASGLNTMIAVQNFDYDYSPGQQGGFRITARRRSSGLEGVLASWGITVGTDQLFDTESETISIPRTVNIAGMRMQTSEPVQAPMQIAVRGEQFNRDLPLSNRLETIFYLWGSDVAVDESKTHGLDLTAAPLFHSSSRSWLTPFTGQPLSRADIDPRGRDFGGPLPLAWSLGGMFPAPEGAAPAWPAEAALDSATAAASPPQAYSGEYAEAKLLVLGGAKLFEDSFLRSVPTHPLFLLNSADALAAEGELIGIRSKAISIRSIKPLEAGQKLLFRIWAVILIPLVLTLYGISRMVMRRKDAALYRDNLALKPTRRA